MRCRMGSSDSLYATATGMANSFVQRQMISNMMNMFTREGGAQQQASAGGVPSNVI